MIPDGKTLIIGHLNADPSVAALQARAAAKPPNSMTRPWIRVTQLDATNANSRVEHLISYLIQLDCYAGQDGGTVEASALARTARAALHAMPNETFEDAVVTSVRFTGMLDLPDPDIEPASDRVILTAVVHAHPTYGS